ncbi:MAG: GNAT family N-acetyltransferase [Chloroflexi bacterium]|nr:GNAT family N-acetyltransferase [Chloroflexota bacterium]
MNDQIVYRILTENADLEQASHLEAVIWGWDVQFASPTNVMRVSALKGGLVLCAYDRGAMIGMSWAFPAFTDGQWVLWSHVAGVLPNYRGQGIGAGIKWAQRKWALEHGYREIRWTFDPMQAGNANFNLRVLGVSINKYLVNMYGTYDDALNPGLPTDRFEARWELASERVGQAEQGRLPVVDTLPDTMLVRAEGDGIVTRMTSSQPSACVEIPASFSTLGRENRGLAERWQAALRTQLTDAFERGFVIENFVRRDGRCWYVLKRRALSSL